MRVLSVDRLKDCGYTVNRQGNFIYPIKQKSHSYTVSYKGFSIMVNNYPENASERQMKNAVLDTIDLLSRNRALIYNREDKFKI